MLQPRLTDHDSSAIDLFKQLSQTHIMQAQFEKDIQRIDLEINKLDKGGMKFPSPAEIEKKYFLQNLKQQRVATHMKEKAFLANLSQYREFHMLNDKLMTEKGQSLQYQYKKREQILKFKLMSEQIQTEKSKFERDLANPNTFQSAGLSVLMDTSSNNNYKAAISKLHQDEAKLQLLKSQQADSLLLQDQDEVLNAGTGENLYNSAKYLYKGAMSKVPRQKLETLTKLREQLEQYNQGDTKLILPIEEIKDGNQIPKASEMSYLNDIDQLRQDYFKAGGTDPNFLLNLNNLEKTLRNPHQQINQYPNQQQQFNRMPYSQSQNNSFHQQHNISYSQPSFNGGMHYNEGPNISRISSHPIFDYLPQTFKDDLLQLSKSAIPQVIQNKEKSDSTNPDELTLDYLRNQEAELLLQMSRLDPRTHEHAHFLQQYKDLQKLRASIEKAIFDKKVSDAIAKEEKYRKNLVKNVNLYDRSARAVHFSPSEGFVLFFDYVSNLQIQYHSARINFGVFRKGSDMYPYKQTKDARSSFETYRTNKVVFFERELMRDMEPQADTFMFLELWGYQQDSPMVIGWSMLRLFNDENMLIVGKFRIPLYNKAINPNLIFKQPLPYVNSTLIYGRICLPFDPILDSSDVIIIENEYNMPDMHVHTTAHTALLAEIQDIYLKPQQDNEKRGSELKTDNSGEQSRTSKLNQSRSRFTKQSQAEQPSATSRFSQKLFKPSQRSQADTPQEDSANRSSFVQTTLIFKLVRLSQTQLFNDIKLKLGIFLGAKMLENLDGQPQMALLELNPTSSDGNEIMFKTKHEFSLQLEFLQNMKIDDCMLFMGFFKDHKDLFGWLAVPLFDENQKLKLGAYSVNMLSPPGQSPPFDQNKMKKSEIQIDFLLMLQDQKASSLPVYNLYKDLKGQDESQLDNTIQNKSQSRTFRSRKPDESQNQIPDGAKSIKIKFEQMNHLVPGSYCLKIAIVDGSRYLYDINNKKCALSTQEYEVSEDYVLDFEDYTVEFNVDFLAEQNKDLKQENMLILVYVVNREKTLTWFVHELFKYGRYVLPTLDLPWQKPPVVRSKCRNHANFNISFDLRIIK